MLSNLILKLPRVCSCWKKIGSKMTTAVPRNSDSATSLTQHSALKQKGEWHQCPNRSDCGYRPSCRWITNPRLYASIDRPLGHRDGSESVRRVACTEYETASRV